MTEHATSATSSGHRRGWRRWWPLGAALAVVAALVLALTQPWTALVNRTVDEAAPLPAAAAAPAGDFTSLAHETTGQARLITRENGTTVLRLEQFGTTNGPDLRVWLVDRPAAGATSARDGAYVDLGALKGNRGNQNYEVPGDVDLADVRSVVIWCDRFSVAFGAADLSWSAG